MHHCACGAQAGDYFCYEETEDNRLQPGGTVRHATVCDAGHWNVVRDAVVPDDAPQRIVGAFTSSRRSGSGVGRGSFIDSILAAIDGYYQTVLQGIRPWIPKAPQLPKAGAALAAAGIDTTVLPTERIDTDDMMEDSKSPHDPESSSATEADESSDFEPFENARGPLVSWEEQQNGIREERSAGLPADDDDTFDSPSR